MPPIPSLKAPPSNDYTADFQQLVSQQAKQYPPPNTKPTRKDLPPNVVKAQKQWLQQAYVIRRHIVSLLAFLYSIRRQYLALSSKGVRPTSAAGQGESDISSEQATSSAFAKWQAYKGPLTEKQRDEIDFQVKVVVKRCLESVKELELAEEARKKTAPTTPSALSPLHTILALSTPKDSSSSILASSMISAHRSSVIQYLSILLSKASALQSDMQERRLKAQREKSKSLANSRAPMLAEKQGQEASSSSAVPIKGSVGGSYNPAVEGESQLVGKDISTQLSAQQIEMFENESSELIKSLESDLANIKKAESRLYEISDLQTQVAQQLEQQGEITDRLMDEAIGVGTEVGKGNEELRKARERSRAADKMLAVFLAGSGLTLLFLHWMD